jgi:hypothetical protein
VSYLEVAFLSHRCEDLKCYRKAAVPIRCMKNKIKDGDSKGEKIPELGGREKRI